MPRRPSHLTLATALGQPGPAKVRILLVEDDRVDQMAFRRAILSDDLPYDLEIAGSVSEARGLLAASTFDFLVTDHKLPDGTAFDVVSEAKLPWIVITGSGDEGVAVAALRAGALDYLVKASDGSHLKVLPFLIASARRLAQSEAQNRMLSLAMTSILDAVYIVNVNDQITFVNPAFERLYGHSAEQVVGQTERVLWPDESAPGAVAKTAASEAEWSGEVFQLRSDGVSVPVWLTQSLLTDEDGKIAARVCVARDTTESRRVQETLKRANEELERSRQTLQEIASRDELTGLMNRREFARLFTEETSRALRSERPLSVVLIDIDHFKQVNDRHGHAAGDEVLKHVADLLRRTFRLIDRTARIGGEEFAMLLPETNIDGATIVAERIRQLVAMSSCAIVDGKGAAREVSVTISAGVATCPKAGTSLADVLSAADRGLYRAKTEGRNRVVRADKALRSEP